MNAASTQRMVEFAVTPFPAILVLIQSKLKNYECIENLSDSIPGSAFNGVIIAQDADVVNPRMEISLGGESKSENFSLS